MGEIDTSIVLATCSRARMLRRALSSLLADAVNWGKPVEIVVVDDGSTDDTADVLADFKRTSAVPFLVLTGKRQGVAAARNLAAEHARGTWLASFDDDQLALPGWLSALRTAADSTASICVGGSLELDLPQGRSIDEFGLRTRVLLGENLAPSPPPSYRPASNNVLIRHDVFTEFGGYDPSFTEGAEDVDLFDRFALAGHPLVFEPAAKALHVTPDSRLERQNLRWTARRIGASDARRFARRGTTESIKRAIARGTVTMLRDIPQLVWFSITRNRKALLNVLCSFWYSQGLLRMFPVFFFGRQSTSKLLRSFDFRARNGERSDFTARPYKEM